MEVEVPPIHFGKFFRLGMNKGKKIDKLHGELHGVKSQIRQTTNSVLKEPPSQPPLVLLSPSRLKKRSRLDFTNTTITPTTTTGEGLPSPKRKKIFDDPTSNSSFSLSPHILTDKEKLFAEKKTKHFEEKKAYLLNRYKKSIGRDATSQTITTLEKNKYFMALLNMVMKVYVKEHLLKKRYFANGLEKKITQQIVEETWKALQRSRFPPKVLFFDRNVLDVGTQTKFHERKEEVIRRLKTPFDEMKIAHMKYETIAVLNRLFLRDPDVSRCRVENVDVILKASGIDGPDNPLYDVRKKEIIDMKLYLEEQQTLENECFMETLRTRDNLLDLAYKEIGIDRDVDRGIATVNDISKLREDLLYVLNIAPWLYPTPENDNGGGELYKPFLNNHEKATDEEKMRFYKSFDDPYIGMKQQDRTYHCLTPYQVKELDDVGENDINSRIFGLSSSPQTNVLTKHLRALEMEMMLLKIAWESVEHTFLNKLKGIGLNVVYRYTPTSTNPSSSKEILFHSFEIISTSSPLPSNTFHTYYGGATTTTTENFSIDDNDDDDDGLGGLDFNIGPKNKDNNTQSKTSSNTWWPTNLVVGSTEFLKEKMRYLSGMVGGLKDFLKLSKDKEKKKKKERNQKKVSNDHILVKLDGMLSKLETYFSSSSSASVNPNSELPGIEQNLNVLNTLVKSRVLVRMNNEEKDESSKYSNFTEKFSSSFVTHYEFLDKTHPLKIVDGVITFTEDENTTKYDELLRDTLPVLDVLMASESKYKDILTPPPNSVFSTKDESFVKQTNTNNGYDYDDDEDDDDDGMVVESEGDTLVGVKEVERKINANKTTTRDDDDVEAERLQKEFEGHRKMLKELEDSISALRQTGGVDKGHVEKINKRNEQFISTLKEKNRNDVISGKNQCDKILQDNPNPNTSENINAYCEKNTLMVNGVAKEGILNYIIGLLQRHKKKFLFTLLCCTLSCFVVTIPIYFGPNGPKSYDKEKQVDVEGVSVTKAKPISEVVVVNSNNSNNNIHDKVTNNTTTTAIHESEVKLKEVSYLMHVSKTGVDCKDFIEQIKTYEDRYIPLSNDQRRDLALCHLPAVQLCLAENLNSFSDIGKDSASTPFGLSNLLGRPATLLDGKLTLDQTREVLQKSIKLVEEGIQAVHTNPNLNTAMKRNTAVLNLEKAQKSLGILDSITDVERTKKLYPQEALLYSKDITETFKRDYILLAAEKMAQSKVNLANNIAYYKSQQDLEANIEKVVLADGIYHGNPKDHGQRQPQPQEKKDTFDNNSPNYNQRHIYYDTSNPYKEATQSQILTRHLMQRYKTYVPLYKVYNHENGYMKDFLLWKAEHKSFSEEVVTTGVCHFIYKVFPKFMSMFFGFLNPWYFVGYAFVSFLDVFSQQISILLGYMIYRYMDEPKPATQDQMEEARTKFKALRDAEDKETIDSLVEDIRILERTSQVLQIFNLVRWIGNFIIIIASLFSLLGLGYIIILASVSTVIFSLNVGFSLLHSLATKKKGKRGSLESSITLFSLLCSAGFLVLGFLGQSTNNGSWDSSTPTEDQIKEIFNNQWYGWMTFCPGVFSFFSYLTHTHNWVNTVKNGFTLQENTTSIRVWADPFISSTFQKEYTDWSEYTFGISVTTLLAGFFYQYGMNKWFHGNKPDTELNEKDIRDNLSNVGKNGGKSTMLGYMTGLQRISTPTGFWGNPLTYLGFGLIHCMLDHKFMNPVIKQNFYSMLYDKNSMLPNAGGMKTMMVTIAIYILGQMFYAAVFKKKIETVEEAREKHELRILEKKRDEIMERDRIAREARIAELQIRHKQTQEIMEITQQYRLALQNHQSENNKQMAKARFEEAQRVFQERNSISQQNKEVEMRLKKENDERRHALATQNYELAALRFQVDQNTKKQDLMEKMRQFDENLKTNWKKYEDSQRTTAVKLEMQQKKAEYQKLLDSLKLLHLSKNSVAEVAEGIKQMSTLLAFQKLTEDIPQTNPWDDGQYENMQEEQKQQIEALEMMGRQLELQTNNDGDDDDEVVNNDDHLMALLYNDNPQQQPPVPFSGSDIFQLADDDDWVGVP